MVIAEPGVGLVDKMGIPKMNTFKFALPAMALALVVVGGAAQAEDKLAVAYNIGVQSNYEFRGISQTDKNASLFGGADATYGKFYAGTWLSNVEFHNGTSIEYDFYAGFKPQAGPVALDLGVIYYGYGNKPSGADEAYTEVKVAGSVPVGKATVGAAVYYSPEFPFKTGEATYYEVNGSVPLNDKWSVSGALGHQDVVGPADYTTWNVGLGYALNSKVGLDLRYWDTDEHNFGRIFDSRLVLGIKATF